MNHAPQRFLSLDVFRGMTICFMIIVNTPGAGADAFAPLQHAAWHGFTPTDLVFPSFLFAVGNAMSFSLVKYKQISDAVFLKKVIRRTALIFLLGYLMYWFPFFRISEAGAVVGAPIQTTRIMGVLQRIALCYFFASLLIHYCRAKTVYAVSALLLVGYWVVLLIFGDRNDPFGITANAGYYIDKALLGESHMYGGEGVAFDPEGLLSTLPAIVNVITGYYAGLYIQRTGKGYETMAKLLLAGGLLILIALCWHTVFPINKKLWTSPFVLLTTGIDLMVIAALLYSVELRQWNGLHWTRFFTVFGKNPLFIYLLSEVLAILLYTVRTGSGASWFEWIGSAVFQNLMPGAFGSLLFALFFMLLCWSIGWLLDRKRIYVRV